MTVRAYIGIGSNCGDRKQHIEQALSTMAAHDEIGIIRTSSYYETEPVGEIFQGLFLNAVTEIDTALQPQLLLAVLEAIECLQGRAKKSEPRWSPRAIDLDILFYGQECISEPLLEIPHLLVHERTFVLEPLCELAPDYVHPRFGVTVGELYKRLSLCR